MADPAHGIAAQIRGIEQRYGKPIGAWIELVKASSLSKHQDVVATLKTYHGMTHGAAHRIALLARNTDPARGGIRSRELSTRSTPESGRPFGRSTTC